MVKKKQDECTNVYYGIHSQTNEVRSVWVTRDGRMSSGLTQSHYLMPGRDVRDELIIVFGLSDAVSIAPHMLQSDHAKQVIADLEKKAEQMKAAKEAEEEHP
ncbi:hypothetical protein [Micavibrio aeruginosavorus]|uniref:hypothetical protein n=1 Tax=Micavibrio aeruginosavorus TaxID=349221 RepID=UPI00059EEB57|nr:hypothetical protein [Micavibrio aeruginosavorus]